MFRWDDEAVWEYEEHPLKGFTWFFPALIGHGSPWGTEHATHYLMLRFAPDDTLHDFEVLLHPDSGDHESELARFRNPSTATTAPALRCGQRLNYGPPPQTTPSPAHLRTQTVTIRTRRDVENVSFDVVHVPAGRITIKDAQGHDVEHAIKPFWIAKYETRWDEYNVFWRGFDLTESEWFTARLADSKKQKRTDQPYWNPAGGTQTNDGAGYPADCVTLNAAKKYCAWLSSVTGKKFRLPTEAEWEYACRAGGPPLRLDAAELDAVAWYLRNAADLPYGYGPGTRFDEDYGRVRPVGQKRPNRWGLYDMLGNVGEYVIRDPMDDKGLLAGGSFQDDAKDVYSGAREPYSEAWRKGEVQIPFSPDWLNWSLHRAGFRVVMDEWMCMWCSDVRRSTSASIGGCYLGRSPACVHAGLTRGASLPGIAITSDPWWVTC
jgi:formylglycine-generating enzyme required for sulfatase activity